jgi:uncharacterized membrane protein YcaP (DUF421 family)
MFSGWQVLLNITLRTLAVYFLVLVGVRLSGKREVGQMTPFDLTLLLLLSNSVQNAMTGSDNSLAGGAVAAVTLLVLNYLIAEVAGVNRRFRKFIKGQPSLLIHNGEIITSHCAREHISIDDIQQGLREHGISSVKEVAVGVLEVDGSISFLKHDDVPEASHARRRVKFLQKH